MELNRDQVIEGNQMFAKLLGWYQIGGFKDCWYENLEFAAYVAYSEHNNYPHKGLPFHRDWLYLMRVIDSIGKLVYDDENWKSQYGYNDLFAQIYSKSNSTLMNCIEGVWLACLNCLKNYV